MSTPDPHQEAAEALARMRVEQLVASAVESVLALGFARTSGEERDPAQVQVAIETVRALLPVVEQFVPPAAMADLRSALAQLQLTYASAFGGAPPAGEPAAPAARPEPPPPPPQRRPTIWTPGGER